MQLSHATNVIGLKAYRKNIPSRSFYSHFYSLILAQSARLGIVPTYFGVGGKGYPEKHVKFKGPLHQKVLASDFGDITNLSITATSPDSDAPFYDSFFDCSVGLHKSGYPEFDGKMVELTFTCNQAYLEFASDAFENVLCELSNIYDWDFGMGFSDTVDHHPEYYISEFGHEGLTDQEREDLQKWYSTPPEIRLIKLRDVYPYNIVNENQLNRETGDGRTLRQFIEERPESCTLEKVTDSNLYLWKVLDCSAVEKLRTVLRGSSVLAV